MDYLENALLNYANGLRFLDFVEEQRSLLNLLAVEFCQEIKENPDIQIVSMDYLENALLIFANGLNFLDSVEEPRSLLNLLVAEFCQEDHIYMKESDPESYVMLLAAQSKFNIFKNELVIKAFKETAKAHKGRMRANGDSCFKHCLETACLLATLCAHSMVVVVGLLHDILDDSCISYDHILQTFGAESANLIQEVSKLGELSWLARERNITTETIEADRLHTMFLAKADVRAILIKLADRLHNMKTLDALPSTKQSRLAKETMAIFVPLANRLGITDWKETLEDMCFKYINKEKYDDLSSQLSKSFNKDKLAFDVHKLEQALKDQFVSDHVLKWRQKSLYSIYSKMINKNLSIGKINDIHGIRLIMENEEDCYKALQLVHGLWPEQPNKFKDYITHPKSNGYQSLHTVVIREEQVPLEVQIRTKAMHSQADLGNAAHWRYKEGDRIHSEFVSEIVEWARSVVPSCCESILKDHDYTDSMKPFRFEDCPHSSDGIVLVVVIENDETSVQEFLANSTIMDLITRIGQGSFRQELMVKINRVLMSDLSSKLKMGDVVEISH